MHDAAIDYAEVVEARIRGAMNTIGLAPAGTFTVNQIAEFSAQLGVPVDSWFPLLSAVEPVLGASN